MNNEEINKFAHLDTLSTKTEYNGIQFKSLLEAKWYKFLTEKFVKCKVLYEPLTIVRYGLDKDHDAKNIVDQYTPDFAIMPSGNRRTNMSIDYIFKHAIFCEAKPKIYELRNDRFTSQDKINHVYLVERVVMLLYGYPDMVEGEIINISTLGYGNQQNWKLTRCGKRIDTAMGIARSSLREWKNDSIVMNRRSVGIEKINQDNY